MGVFAGKCPKPPHPHPSLSLLDCNIVIDISINVEKVVGNLQSDDRVHTDEELEKDCLMYSWSGMLSRGVIVSTKLILILFASDR